MRKVCTKMVPKILMTEQKANQRDVCFDLLDRLEWKPEFFSRIITGDESWILEYDPDTKRQSREWHTANPPCPKKTRMSKSKKQIDAHLFFWESADRPQGICATRTNCQSNFYREVLVRLRKRVVHVQPGIARTWMLHHDNAPCHTAVYINEFLAEKSIPVFPQPPIRRISVPVTSFYSPGSKTTWIGAILLLWIISRRA